MGKFSVPSFVRVAVVTDHTASGVTHGFTFFHDLVEHLGSDFANRFNVPVALHTTGRCGLRKMIDQSFWPACPGIVQLADCPAQDQHVQQNQRLPQA